jgi:anaphase-promoting complex subunit 8
MYDYGKPKGMCYEEVGRFVPFGCKRTININHQIRLREAIECYKRALITADPHEITLRLKLARVHKNLEEYAEAVAYHRTVVEVCQADCK